MASISSRKEVTEMILTILAIVGLIGLVSGIWAFIGMIRKRLSGHSSGKFSVGTAIGVFFFYSWAVFSLLNKIFLLAGSDSHLWASSIAILLFVAIVVTCAVSSDKHCEYFQDSRLYNSLFYFYAFGWFAIDIVSTCIMLARLP